MVDSEVDLDEEEVADREGDIIFVGSMKCIVEEVGLVHSNP